MTDVLNITQLEKQLKRVEKRMEEIRAEYADLEQKRAALGVLLSKKLGQVPGLQQSAANGVKPQRQRLEGGLHGQIKTLLGDGEMSAPEILKALEAKGITVGGKNKHTSVYIALKRHEGKLFEKTDGDKWKVKI